MHTGPVLLRTASVLLVVLTAAGPARAQERSLAEAITVAEGDPCLDVDGLVAHVATWLGRDRIAAELGVVVETSVVVETGATDASFAITRAGERTATRRFDDLPVECADRRAVIALAIALALDAAVLESIGIPAPEPERPPVHGEPDVPPPPRAPAGERPAFSLEAEGMLLVEVLPELALAGAVSIAGLLGGGFRLRGGVVATQRLGTAIGHGAAEMTLVAGRIDGCYAPAVTDGLLLGGCVGALAGALLAEGRGFAYVRTTEIPWIGAAARAELRWLPASALALGLAVEGLFSIVRPRLDVGDGAGGVLAARSLPPAGLGVVLSAAMVIE